MAYRLRGPGALLGTALGRCHLRYGICDRAGPLLFGAVGLYRRALLIKGRHTQRLRRIAPALQGRDVRCELVYCNVGLMECSRCPMLGRPWSGIWPDDADSRRAGRSPARP
jgi:hypothetical protein